MMDAIWKYPLPTPYATVLMPAGAVVLTARIQREAICLWAHVNPNNPPVVHRTFVCINTGDPFDAHGLQYIATDESDNGIVWHVYEKVVS